MSAPPARNYADARLCGAAAGYPGGAPLGRTTPLPETDPPQYSRLNLAKGSRGSRDEKGDTAKMCATTRAEFGGNNLLDNLAFGFTCEGQDEQAQNIDHRDRAGSARK